MEQGLSWEANRPQLVKKFPTFYGTRRFINAFTSARHLSLSWARSIKSMPHTPTPLTSCWFLSPRHPQVADRVTSSNMEGSCEILNKRGGPPVGGLGIVKTNSYLKTGHVTKRIHVPRVWINPLVRPKQLSVYVIKNWSKWNSEQSIKSKCNVMQNMCTELTDSYSTIGWTTFIFICVTPEMLTLYAIPQPPDGRLFCLKLFAPVLVKHEEQTGLRPVVTFFTLYHLPMLLHTHTHTHTHTHMYLRVLLFT